MGSFSGRLKLCSASPKKSTVTPGHIKEANLKVLLRVWRTSDGYTVRVRLFGVFITQGQCQGQLLVPVGRSGLFWGLGVCLRCDYWELPVPEKRIGKYNDRSTCGQQCLSALLHHISSEADGLWKCQLPYSRVWCSDIGWDWYHDITHKCFRLGLHGIIYHVYSFYSFHQYSHDLFLSSTFIYWIVAFFKKASCVEKFSQFSLDSECAEHMGSIWGIRMYRSLKVGAEILDTLTFLHLKFSHGQVYILCELMTVLHVNWDNTDPALAFVIEYSNY